MKDFVVEQLKKEIEGLKLETRLENVGRVVRVADGTAWVWGLSRVMLGETVKIESRETILAQVLALEQELAGLIILGDWQKVKEGDLVKRTEQILSVPVGEELIGRTVDPLGRSLDGQGLIKTKELYPAEKVAPGIIERQPVSRPLHTGIKAIDAMIPIGRGQRELIIGDRQTGKTSIAIDAIINQADQNVVCVYCAIGQKDAKIFRVLQELKKKGALKYTIVVSAPASYPASLQYLAPYSATAMGEYFMDKGLDVLAVYDDLSKHAIAYRELALVLGRSSGREAYPGDIFYLHSRLLERACCKSKTCGSGTLTALPIIETQAGDIASYIPTNVISITDGQIYLESDLFYQGIRPAVNVGLSVSRVGSAAQIKAMKKVAGRLRLDLAQFRELAAFAQFESDLDKTTQKQIERGRILTEILKQRNYRPLAVEKQTVIIFAGVKGYLDGIEPEKIQQFEEGFLSFLENQYDLPGLIKKTGDLTPETEKKLVKAIEDYKKIFAK